MPVIGTKQTLIATPSMSALRGKPDIPDPLVTQSGHLLARRNHEQTQLSIIFQEADFVTGGPLKAPRQIYL